jgi:hypothetical protein
MMALSEPLTRDAGWTEERGTSEEGRSRSGRVEAERGALTRDAGWTEERWAR